jgi:GTPase Era involved in 16S rRNA processing
VQDELCKSYYPIEVDHVAEKVHFNIVLTGSPRIGKSQLINALSNGEIKAKTSPGLNSCTSQVECYVLEDNQQRTPGVKPFRIHFYDTPGIESWTNENGQTTMLKFIEEKDPVCLIYCAAPGTFADLKQLQPVLEYCRTKQIFCALVCTNMWASPHRKKVIEEFEDALVMFGEPVEKLFDQENRGPPHKVTVFGNSALCTMVNSIEYYDPEFSAERKSVQGIDELIHCIMEALDHEKLLGWCNAVLYRRTYWEKMTQRVNGFFTARLPSTSSLWTYTALDQFVRNFALRLFNQSKK